MIGTVVERDLTDRHCQSSPARLLASRLLISNGEAWRRVRAADGPSTSSGNNSQPDDKARVDGPSTSSGNEDITCAESVEAPATATSSGDEEPPLFPEQAGAPAEAVVEGQHPADDQPNSNNDRAFRKPNKRWRLGNGHGITSDGTILTVAEIAVLANEAEIITVWMSKTGEILDEGRTKRCATRAQTLALIARDVGCSFPGCDRPPEWCERHHIVSWLLNGKTDIDNLTLLCRCHHHNFEQLGWTCCINSEGLPE